MTENKSIDSYIRDFPEETQKCLQEIRKTIAEVAPLAKEDIKWGMPTFVLKKNLVHFAGFKHHIGLYPMPGAINFFEKELAAYKHAKGSIQFPIDKPLPLGLIRRIIEFRVKEMMEK